jgi:nucleoside-diphosphate-sugar epimerase
MAQSLEGHIGKVNRQKVLVTGANGFIGRALVAALTRDGTEVSAALRRITKTTPGDFDARVPVHAVGDIGPTTDWGAALDGVQAVVHLAARVHVMNENALDPLTEFRRVNTLGTIRHASMAAQAGVRRFVYVSTIKVNGEATADMPFRDDDRPRPSDPYAVSKWEAEQGLRRIASETGMEIVIIRPPLVYGPGVGGNFLAILKWINRGIPLPLASVRNQRSLVGLRNLVSLIVSCLSHPGAAGEVFLVSDGEDLSTPDLLRRVAHALGKRSRLFPFPVSLLHATARALGKDGACERLCGSLKVDSGKARRLLEWNPPLAVDDELQAVGEWYRHNISKDVALL